MYKISRLQSQSVAPLSVTHCIAMLFYESGKSENRIIGKPKKISLGMLRSDLMLESGCPELSPHAFRSKAGADEAAGTTAAAAATPPPAIVGTEAGTVGGTVEEKIKKETVAAAERAKNDRKDCRELQLSQATTEQKMEARSASAYCCWKQVEINTIASGFGHLGPASKTIQRCCPQSTPPPSTPFHSPLRPSSSFNTITSSNI